MKLKQANILVVDDDTDVLTAVQLLLKTEASMVITEKNPEIILSQLAKNKFDIMLLDMNFTSAVNTGNEGFFWLKKIKELNPQLSIIMITAYGGIDIAVRSLKEGADDFIVKPWHNEKLIDSIKEILERKEEKKTFEKNNLESVLGSELIAESQIMKDIFYKIDKIASTDANILILGENGTGKDLVAKAIHQCSTRKNKPYIKVDIGSLTTSLFESELFGHKKGSFTDAKNDRIGFFEAANSGTLFLDEIGNIELPLQAKLLSVLQNRQVIRLGTNEAIPIDIRLICATNLPLNELANENRFRKDLIYRINTIEIIIPPLSKREDDVILLAKHFAQLYAKKYMRPNLNFEKSALEKLKNYHFPGNVRELQYTIERAVIMANTEVLSATDLIFSPIESISVNKPSEELKLSAVERNTIKHVIEKHSGNITKAAKELGITRTALYRRLDKHDL